MAVSKAELKKLAELKTKKGRLEQNRLLVGGVRVLEEALKFSVLPTKLLYCQDQISGRGLKLLDLFRLNKVQVAAVTAKEIQAVSDTETTQGLLGIFDTPELNLSKLYKSSYRRVLLCDRIGDPGNLGTLVRTALAFDFDMVMVADNTVELFNPKVVRASAGTIFAVPVVKVSYPELIEFKESTNSILAAAVANDKTKNLSAGLPLASGDKEVPLILAIGSEAEGLSDEVLAIADHRISIKHNPQVESLNAAVAGALLMSSFYQNDDKKDFE